MKNTSIVSLLKIGAKVQNVLQLTFFIILKFQCSFHKTYK